MRVLLTASVMCCAIVGLSRAEEAQALMRRPTNIPAQALRPALQLLAKERDVQVVFRTDVVAELRTPGAAGELTIEEALKQLLSGTGLKFRYLDEKTVTIVPIAIAPTHDAQSSIGESSRGGREASSSFRSRLRLAQADTGTSRSSDVSAAPAETAESSSEKLKHVTLEEIVVSARKRGAESLQDLPLSMQTLDSEQLERRNATGIGDVARQVSGVSLIDLGGNKKKLKIRGVSSSAFDEPQETVAVYLEDVPITGSGGTDNENSPAPDVGLLDLQRIEVLKGPQSTLYGASSMGGTVRYVLNPPDPAVFSGLVGAETTHTERGGTGWAGKAVFNVPVGDRFAVRVASQYREEEGYVRNILQTGFANEPRRGPEDDINTHSAQSHVLSGLWEASDNFNVTARYVRHDYVVDMNDVLTIDTQEKTAPANLRFAPDDLIQAKLTKESSKDRMDIGALTIAWNLGWGTLTSASSYRTRDVRDRGDESRVMSAFFGALPAPIGGTSQIPATLRNFNDSDQIVEELRLASASGGRVEWVGGLYYTDLDKSFIQSSLAPGFDDHLVTLGLPPNSSQEVFANPFPDSTFYGETQLNQREFAIFGEATYAIADAWNLTLGLRWFDIEQERRRFAAGIVNGGRSPSTGFDEGTLSEDGVNPKATLSYQANDALLVYGTAARGYRAGGINQSIPFDPDNDVLGCAAELISLGFPSGAPLAFGSDFLWNYELGAKATLGGGSVQLDGSLYRIDWRDLQTPALLACGFTFFSNTGQAEVDGAELGVRAVPLTGLEISLNVGYSDSRLSRTDPVLGFPEGSRLPGASEWTVSSSASYDFAIAGRTAYAQIDYTYASEFNSAILGSASPLNRVAGGFGLANFSAGIDWSDALSIGVFATNLTDRRGVTSALFSVFGDDVFVARPRRFGLRLQYRW